MDPAIRTARGNIVLRPSKRKILLVILVTLGFTVIGIVMIRDGEGLDGWFVAVVFGCFLAMALAQFLPGAAYLKLTPKGFICAVPLRRRQLIPWARVSRFYVEKSGYGKGVFYNPPSGGRHALPTTYGLTAHELAELMNDWRDRAIGP